MSARGAARVLAVLIVVALFAPLSQSPYMFERAAAAAPGGNSAELPYPISGHDIWTYFARHGGVNTFGEPISNEFKLLGTRVQLFQRQVIEVRASGEVGTVDLISSGLLPHMHPSPGSADKVPRPGEDRYLDRASTFLDRNAPDTWQGNPVLFNTTLRSSMRCRDLVGIEACSDQVRLALTIETWGLPVGPPVADRQDSDFTYLWLQRGGLVHSQSANRTDWLLLGKLVKDVLLGNELPPDLLNGIHPSPGTARFYAQYDPTRPNALARPAELPGTSLAGAFHGRSVANQPLLDIASVPRSAKALALDTRFGVAEAFRDPQVMLEVGGGWQRIVLPWDDIQPKAASDFSRLGVTFPQERLAAEPGRGIRIAAVLQSTPGWAQLRPADGKRSVPSNLDLPFDDPKNYWGQFVFRTVQRYKGQIDEWILWNEPDFRADEPGGADASTWMGSASEFAQLLRVGYLAAKKANPHAVVSFPATSYWADETSRPKRPQFYDRVMAELARAPGAAANGFYHDAVALNLYGNPDDVLRVHSIFEAIQRRYGVTKPVWLTEFNVIPVDDPLTPCGRQLAAPRSVASLDQQADYVVQSVALAAAAGYERIQFFQMADGDPCRDQAWGLTRNDGTRRPAFDALRTTVNMLAGYTQAGFVPLAREPVRKTAWPNDPAAYETGWQVYQVIFEKPGKQRITVLWSGDGGRPLGVRVPKSGERGWLIDALGRPQPLVLRDGSWEFQLAPASATQVGGQVDDPSAHHIIGGRPVFLIEHGAAP